MNVEQRTILDGFDFFECPHDFGFLAAHDVNGVQVFKVSVARSRTHSRNEIERDALEILEMLSPEY